MQLADIPPLKSAACLYPVAHAKGDENGSSGYQVNGLGRVRPGHGALCQILVMDQIDLQGVCVSGFNNQVGSPGQRPPGRVRSSGERPPG